MENDLQIGFEVQLKSGGPVMTIDSIDTATSRATCVWFDAKHNMQNAKFALHTLEKYDDSPLPGGGIYVM